jgi:ferredoxin-NADP reductase
LTGRARILVGQDAQVLYPRVQRCVQVTIDDHLLRNDALPFRLQTREFSPYNPMVPSSQRRVINQENDKRISATLSNITRHTKDIATFHFTTSHPIHYIPGQYAVLDLSRFNTVEYASNNPQSLNDDYIRTWTISSAPRRKINKSVSSSPLSSSSSSSLPPSQDTTGIEDWQETSEFTMTIKRKLGGALSNLLHDLILDDQHPFTVPLVSTGGIFVLPSLSSVTQEKPLSKIILISGGIGSTPFISMLRGARQVHKGSLDIRWVASAPYFDNVLPEVLQEITAPLNTLEKEEEGENDQGENQDGGRSLTLSVDIFLTREKPTDVSPTLLSGGLHNTTIHWGRLDSQTLLTVIPDIHDRQILLCGPDPFMEAVKGNLQELGVSVGQILVEEFNF